MTAVPARTSWWETRLPAPALIPLAGIIWWGIGFLPWILNGLGLETAGGTPVSTVTRMAVPLYAGNVGSLVLYAGAGGLAAGLVALLGRDTRARNVSAVCGGVAVTMLALVVHSRHALGAEAASTFATDHRVLDGLTWITVLMTALGLGVGLLAVTGPVGRGIALAGVSGAVPVWGFEALVSAGFDGPTAFTHVADVTRWAGAVVLAGALVAIGARSLGRLAWWPVAVLLAWIVGPTVTAAAYIEPLLRPGAGLPDTLWDSISAAGTVWRLSASPDARPLTPWIAAVVAAAFIAFVLAQRETPTSEDASTDDPATGGRVRPRNEDEYRDHSTP